MRITFGNATVKRLEYERELAERLNHLRFFKITECLLRIHHGQSFRAIADWLHLSLRTVYNWLSLFIRRRFAWLCGHHFQGRGRKARLRAEHRQRLYELIVQGPLAYGFTCGVWTSSMIAVLIEREFGVTYHPRSVCRLLHQIGITYQKAAFVSDKVDDEEHERKRQKWEQETWPAILKRACQLQAVILFGAEVSFAQWGSLFRTWASCGKQPKVPTCGKPPPSFPETGRREAAVTANPCNAILTHSARPVQTAQSRITPGCAPRSQAAAACWGSRRRGARGCSRGVFRCCASEKCALYYLFAPNAMSIERR
jgi:transposase